MSLIVYKSSAGSGKTFTLVLEYLALVLRKPSLYRHILAITFTNKAANELKARVIQALWLLSSAEAKSSKARQVLVVQLAKHGLTDEVLMVRNATLAFSAILHNFSDFNIGTIDAFTHRLVRTFARELALPSAFNVELSSRVLLSEVVNDLMEKVGSDAFITEVIIDFVMNRVEEEGDWKVDRALKSYAEELIGEEAFLMMNTTSATEDKHWWAIRKHIGAEISRIEAGFRSKAQNILDLLQSAGIAPESLFGKTRGIGPVLQRISQGELQSIFEAKTIHTGFQSDSPFVNKSTDKAVLVAFAGIEISVLSEFKALENWYESTFSRFLLLKLLHKNIHGFALQSKIMETMQAIITQKQLVHISEFNKRVAELLQNSAVAFIYERLGEKYRHFLLDEFQDTSVLQWQNFLPLIENSLASGHQNLIVGDGKQSIYRFRNGEFQQFLLLPQIFRANENLNLLRIQQLLKQNYVEKNLDTNYRSAKDIVEFNNDFFDFLLQKLPTTLQTVFHNQKQKVFQTAKSGTVSFDFFDKDADMDALVLERVIEIIYSQLEAGFALRDIAVLVYNNAVGNTIARFLASQGMAVVSADSLLLNASSSVRLIYNALVFYAYPQNTLNRFELLMNLFSSPAYDTNTPDSNWMNFYNEMSSSAQISYLKNLISWQEIMPGTGIYDLAEKLVRLLQLQIPADPYVQFFLDEIYGFQTKEQKGLDAFLDYWRQEGNSKSVVIPDSMDAVKVMTIHKAKGLEFPVVIFPFANKSVSRTTKKNLWLDLSNEGIGGLNAGFVSANKTLQSTTFGHIYDAESDKTKLDSVNMLYVAFTRAVDRLFVLADVPTSVNFSFPFFFKDYLVNKGLWSDDSKSYIIGNDLDSPKEPQIALQQVPATNLMFVSEEWNGRLMVAHEPAMAKFEKSHEAQAYGNLIHEIFSQIKIWSDAVQVLQRYVSNGYLNTEQSVALTDLLLRLQNDAAIAPLFSPEVKVKTEVELLAKTGKIYRTDRYVEFSEKVVLLDYKTGTKDAHHQRQMKQYVQVVSDLQPKPIEAFLLYLDDLTDYQVERVE